MVVLHLRSFSWPEAVALFVWVLAMKCAAMDVDPLQALVAEAFVKAMQRAEITPKAAALTIRVDEPTFRKMLSGSAYRHLNFIHAIKLGPIFMAFFSASLMWLTVRQHAQEIMETVNVRKGA